jgi:hypothetical protein
MPWGIASGRTTWVGRGAMGASHLPLNLVMRYTDKVSAGYSRTAYCHGRASLAWEKSLC